MPDGPAPTNAQGDTALSALQNLQPWAGPYSTPQQGLTDPIC